MPTKKSTAAPKAEKPKKKATKKAPAVVEPAPAQATSAAPAEPRPRASHEQVARRAYEIWLARGGNAFENWVEAERQLNGE